MYLPGFRTGWKKESSMMEKHFIIQRKVLISMLFIASTLLGYLSYKQLNMELIPNAELPMLYIQVNASMDMTPDYMEQEAIIPIESAVASLENIERIESTAGRRRGGVVVYYENRTDIKYAYLKLDERLSALRGSLPDEFTIRLEKVNTEDNSNVLMQLQTLGEGGVDRVRNMVDQYISPALLNIDGVAVVNVFGGREKSVEIILDRNMCEAYHVSPARIRNILSRNMNQRQYGGMIRENGLRYFTYLNAEYDEISQIEDLLVGKNVRIKDIATVFYGEKEEETISRINGMDAVSITIINDAQANIIDLSHAVREKIAELNKEYKDEDLEIIIQDDTAEEMENNIDQIINLALVGGLLAIFILWIFLRNIRLVTIVALAMPVSVYTAFNFFYAAGITVNSLTLMGIALAVGMLLDTSVVVLENIYRLRAAGVGRTEAVVKGTGEVWRAIVASTLTTVSVFVPFLFSTDYMIKLLGKHIGVSIISTLSISLLVSLLLIPMIVNIMLSRSRKKQKEVYQEVTIRHKGIRIYLAMLKTAIRNPGPTIIGVVLLFFTVIILSLTITVNKLTALETNQITLYVTMHTGTTLEATDEIVSRVEDALMDLEERDQIISSIEEEEATVKILLKEDYRSISKRSYTDIESDILERVKNIPADDITTSSSSSGSSNRGGSKRSGSSGFQQLLGIGQDEEYVVLKGQDFELLVEVADDIETYLEDLDNVRNASESVRENQPEVHLNLNSLLMSEYGVTRNEVSTELGSFQNEISSGVPFRQGTEEYEIIISYDDSDDKDQQQKNIEDLRELEIPDADDQGMYELQHISDVYFSRGTREIERINQEKQVEVRYQFKDDVYESNEMLEYARSEIRDVIESTSIPAGIAVELVQEDNSTEKEFKMLFMIALLLVYMILAALFESFLTPFVLLLSIPFAAIGSVLMLTLTGYSLQNANTMMGFMILLGVVVNNAIILIDFIKILQKRGYSRNRAIMTAGMSRVRPILITTITTCVALIPLAMGQADYVKAIGPPFAITVIGGLSVSTLLTLVFVPMLYNGLEEVRAWFMSLHLVTRILLAVAEAAGITLAILSVDGLMWRIAAVLVTASGIPLAYWFISSSLRKATGRIIPDDQPIRIRIENLVKIYGRPSKVVREFQSGRRLDIIARNKNLKLRPNMDALIWQVPLLVFLIYFSYFYLENGFWQLVTAVAIYGYLLVIIGSFLRYYPKKWLIILRKFVRYLAPILVVWLFSGRWENTGLTIFVGSTWYLVLAIWYSAVLIASEDFNLKKIRKIFRWFVRLVKFIPGIGTKRDEFKALKGVSMEIGTGMFGLLGPNGAGKSTMIRIICGILDQSYGKIWINDIDTQEKREELQGLIGYLPQEFGMYENMPAEEYLEYQAMLKGLNDVEVRRERIKQVLEAVHMWDQRKKKISAYSGGMKQRIGIAQVLLHLPRILVVDEPTAGLDPRERIRFRNLLVELSRSRIVIFSTHIIEDISSSCTTMAVINRGEVLFSGTPGEMTEIAKGRVWKAYLDPGTFEEDTKDKLIIHHMRDNDRIRVRCVSAEKPFPNAEPETPMLEDAYLWLLQQNKTIIVG